MQKGAEGRRCEMIYVLLRAYAFANTYNNNQNLYTLYLILLR